MKYAKPWGILRKWIYSTVLTVLPLLGLSQSHFVENKGQWNEEILFRKTTPGAIVYLKKNGLSILQYDNKAWSKVVEHPEHDALLKFNPSSPKVKAHHYEVEFANSQTLEIHGELEEAYSLNYFIGQDKSQWASNVSDFKQVVYRGVYPNIDIVFTSFYFGYKYDIVLHPGGKLEDVKLIYKHLDGLELVNDLLILKTHPGKIREAVPKSFYLYKGDTINADIGLKLDGNTLGFQNQSKVPHEGTLVIDPEVVFSTYAGNSADNFGFTATYDTLGNLYAGGIVTAPDLLFNPTGRYPTTFGAFDMDYNGGTEDFTDYGFPCDISISKYNSSGTQLVYATLIGGNRNEYPHSIVCDSNQNLIIFGTTFSANYPLGNNPIQDTRAGEQDMILTILNADGSDLINSTFYGGAGKDGLNEANQLKFFYADNFRGEVITDDQYIYVSSCTNSPDFPLVDAVQTLKKGGQEGVVIVFDMTLNNTIWSTYLGGLNDDALYSVDLDSNGTIYVSGGTRSQDLAKTDGLIGPTYFGGWTDGWIAKLDLQTKSHIGTTYWGTDLYDQIFHLEIDFENRIYAAGQSIGDILVQGDVYRNTNSGQFITKFNDSLTSVEWSTVFGTGEGSPDITINAFLVDECRKIFVSGWGGETSTKSYSSTRNLPITSNAAQKTTDGSDFYLAVFSKNAKELLYATYFGGSRTDDHVDGGTSRFDKKGVIYQSVCASCPQSAFVNAISDFPTTPGAFAEKNISPRCSNAAFKIAFGNLNRRPAPTNVTRTVKALDTLNLIYLVSDLDDDSLFIDITPDPSFSGNFIDVPWRTEAYQNASIDFRISPGCDNIGDTLVYDVYVIDQGCPGVLDSTAQIKIVVTPPPVLDPPENVCLTFVENGVRLEWEAVTSSPYFKAFHLHRINPDGTDVRVQSYTNLNATSYTDLISNPKTTDYTYYLVVENLCDALGPISGRVSTVKEFEAPIEVSYLVTATVTNEDHVMVVWSVSKEEDFGNYDIYRKENGASDASYERIGSTFGKLDTFFIDETAKVNQMSYCYAIVVNDNCGNISIKSNPGCTIFLEGSTVPFQHDLWWNPYLEWANEVNRYEMSRSVDTGFLRPIVETNFDVRTLIDTSFDYCWGGYWYRVKAYENLGGYDAQSQSNRIYLIQPPLLHIPNAFTPNGDQLNEIWNIVPVFVKEYEIRVYNRWGQKVYTSTNVKKDWDGFYKQIQRANDVYVYTVTFTGWDRSVHHRKGTVMIVK
jgi:gliding motility-associated-like protein